MDIKSLLKRSDRCVYCLEFPNGMKYVGKTRNLGDRLRIYLRNVDEGVSGKVCDAIREFGWDLVKLDVLVCINGLDKVDTELCLGILEIKYIREMDCIFPKGYNVSLGGEVLRIPPEYITTDSEAIKAFNGGSKALLVYNENGDFVEEYESIARFAYDKGFDEDTVRSVVDKARAFMGKYILRTKKYGYAPNKIDTSGIKIVERKRYKTIVEEKVVLKERYKQVEVPALAYDMNGDFVGEYESRAEAGRMLTGSRMPWGQYIKGYILFKKTSDDYPKKIEDYLTLKNKALDEVYKPVEQLGDLPKLAKPKRGCYKLKNDRPVNQFTLDGEFVAQYPTLRGAAAAQEGISYSQIYACIKGTTKRGGNFIWQWADENESNAEEDIANSESLF